MDKLKAKFDLRIAKCLLNRCLTDREHLQEATKGTKAYIYYKINEAEILRLKNEIKLNEKILGA